MHESVRLGFVDFSLPFESLCDWFYLDVKGYVTIGIGLLAEPMHLIDGLDFRRPDGSQATANEVCAAWLTVHNHQERRKMGGGHFQDLTTVRATKASIIELTARKLEENEAGVRPFFPGWDAFPEGVQMVIMSMCWALGAHGFAKFPHFVAACNAGDWATAAVESHMDEHEQNDSFRLRNAANRALLEAEVQPLSAA